MKTAKLWLCGLLVFATSSAMLFAQGTTVQRCGQHEHHLERMEEDQGYRARIEHKLAETESKVANDQLKMVPCDPADVLIIPVAVHFDTGISNTACVLDVVNSQIDILNEDFTGTNADIANFCTDAENSDLLGSTLAANGACLQFCLATQNHPAGEGLSNGDAAMTFGDYSWTGGADASAWSGYFNIFVAQGTGVLGVSPFFGSGNGDGILLDACAFGSASCTEVGPASGCGFGWNYDLGRSATHEAGHYFGLPHVWGDGGCGADDGFTDTPDSSNDYLGACPSVGAGTSTCGSQDMFMNYMSYSDDACLYMFSEQQAVTMKNHATSLSWQTSASKCQAIPSAPALTDGCPTDPGGGGGDDPVCLIDPATGDGSFESGAAAWTFQADSQYGSPFCTDGTCGANSNSADGYMWFGGYAATATLPYTASFGQVVTFPASGGSPILEFSTLITCAGDPGDSFTVSLDGTVLFSYDNASDQNAICATGGYVNVSVPVPASFMDGGNHTLSFEGTMLGATASNFLFDDISLCILPACSATATAQAVCDPFGTGDGDNFYIEVDVSDLGDSSPSDLFFFDSGAPIGTFPAATGTITLGAFPNNSTVVLSVSTDSDPASSCAVEIGEFSSFCETCTADAGTFVATNGTSICPGDDLVLNANGDAVFSNFPDADSPALAYFIYDSEPVSGDPFGPEFSGSVFFEDGSGNVTVNNTPGGATSTLWVALGTLSSTATGLILGSCSDVDLGNAVEITLLGDPSISFGDTDGDGSFLSCDFADPASPTLTIEIDGVQYNDAEGNPLATQPSSTFTVTSDAGTLSTGTVNAGEGFSITLDEFSVSTSITVSGNDGPACSFNFTLTDFFGEFSLADACGEACIVDTGDTGVNADNIACYGEEFNIATASSVVANDGGVIGWAVSQNGDLAGSSPSAEGDCPELPADFCGFMETPGQTIDVTNIPDFCSDDEMPGTYFFYPVTMLDFPDAVVAQTSNGDSGAITDATFEDPDNPTLDGIISASTSFDIPAPAECDSQLGVESVCVSWSHPFSGDVVLALENNNSGTSITLTNQNGAAAVTNGSLICFVLSDGGTPFISDFADSTAWANGPDLGGNFIPEAGSNIFNDSDPMSAFLGESLCDGFTLTAFDVFPGDEGTVNSISLTTIGAEAAPFPVFDQCCYDIGDPVEMNLLGPITATLVPETSIGCTAEISLSGGLPAFTDGETFSWSISGPEPADVEVAMGADVAEGGSFTFTAEEDGTYLGTATDSEGCSVDFSIELTGCVQECATLADDQSVTESAICAGATVTTMNGTINDADFPGGTVAWYYGIDATFDPYTAGTLYAGEALDNATCAATSFFFKARLDGAGDCQDTSDAFEVMVYPIPMISANNGTCTISASPSCPDFTVMWDDGTTTGAGTTYTAAPGMAGSVTFTATATGAPNGCASATASADFACPDLVCSSLAGDQSIAESTICSGASVTANAGTVVDNDFTGGSAAWYYSMDAAFDPYSAGTAYAGEALMNTDCDAVSYYFKARLDGVDGCLEQSEAFQVEVFASINATIVEDGCTVSVDSNCDYFISYFIDDQGFVESSFTGSPGFSGSIEFFVEQAGAPAGCSQISLVGNYDCPSEVCSALAGDQTIAESAICSGASVTANAGTVVDNDFTGGSAAWYYSMDADFDPYTDGTAYAGEALTNESCDVVFYYFKARLDGVDGCTDVSESTQVTVYSLPTATITEGGCVASISQDCISFTATWTFGDESGEGFEYTAAVGTSGTVTFNLTADAIEACSSLSFEVPFECAEAVCSSLAGDHSVSPTMICAGSSITASAGTVVDNDFTGGSASLWWSTDADFDPYTSGTEYDGSAIANDSCDPISIYFKSRLDGLESCMEVSSAIELVVYPALSLSATDGTCDVAAMASGASVDCGFDVTWMDTDGMSGEGTSYTAGIGFFGNVTFTITNPNAPEGCDSAAAVAAYNCSELVCSALDGTQGVAETAICSGDLVSFTEGGIIDNDFSGGFVTWVYGNTEDFDAYTAMEFIGDLPLHDGCNPRFFFVKARLDGVEGCLDQSEAFAVEVFSSINATIVEDGCTVSVQTECDYFISYFIDDMGLVENSFTASPGSSGSIEFFIEQAGAPAGCNSISLVGNYDCPEVGCTPSEAGICSVTLISSPLAALDVCAGQGVQASTEGTVINDADYSEVFILADGPDLATANILDYSTSGTFTNDGSLDWDATYFVFPAVLAMPYDATMADECGDIGEPVDFTFYAPIEIFYDFICSEGGLTYQVVINISGGDGNYSVSGQNGTVEENNFLSTLITNGETFDLTITDGIGCSVSLTDATICEVPMNNPPITTGDLAFALSNGSAEFNVLDNDMDPDGDDITLTFVEQPDPSTGSFSFDAAGNVTFTAADGYEGEFTVSYIISDGNFETPGSITITVTNEISCATLPALDPNVLISTEGDNFTVYIYVNGGLPTNDDSNYLIQDSEDGVATVGQNEVVILGPYVSETIPMAYEVVITDDLGCSITVEEVIDITVDVELLDFSGEVLAEGNNLKWITQSEFNNAYFKLYRSTDGTNFQEIALVEGAGFSNTILSYDFLDKEAPAGISYYRLEQTDFDNSTTSTAVISLTRAEVSLTVTSVSPVPASNQVQVSFEANNHSQVQIQLFDAAGRKVMATTTIANKGTNSITIPVSDYASGLYFLHMYDGSTTATVKLLKD